MPSIAASVSGEAPRGRTLVQLVDREKITKDTLIIAGDNLLCFDIDTFLDTVEVNATPTIVVHDMGSDEQATSDGLIE